MARFYAVVETFTKRGAFILAKLQAHDDAKLPGGRAPRCHAGSIDITNFEWEIILRYLGPSVEEVKDVQMRMGRPWR